jgi:hypothetical protein
VEKVELIGVETKEDKEFVYEALKEFLQYLPDEDSYDELILASERKIDKCDEQIKKIDRKLGLVGNTDFTAMGMLMAAVYNFANFVIQPDIHEYFKEVIPANLAFLAAFIVKEVYDHNTKDSRTNKLYIDGEFKGNATTYRAITGTTLIFNGWDTGTNYKFNGCLSDFRIYATALSAEDVLALYNTPESIANNGTVITQGEFVEV